MKKIVLIITLVMLISGCAVVPGGQQLADTTFTFDKAIIKINDEIIAEGKVDSWIEFEGSDAIQVKIDGDVYYTHLHNVILINEG